MFPGAMQPFLELPSRTFDGCTNTEEDDHARSFTATNQPTKWGASMKTLAIRLDEEVHAQLSALASIRASTITEEIRSAIESHILGAKASTELSTRAQTVLEEIERESEGRKAAIASLFGSSSDETKQPEVDAPSVGGDPFQGMIDRLKESVEPTTDVEGIKSSKSPKGRAQ